ncbi:MAG: hypothetical protein KatS3mg011_1636 [Acidimicrobiia bacterium]|nr:MAG: hypothetical protein KatS3mg011_1636 [Acidimicrobiia bacterium]
MNRDKVSLAGVGELHYLGLGGFLPAPMIGAASKRAVGLAVAAASNFGLASLGRPNRWPSAPTV